MEDPVSKPKTNNKYWHSQDTFHLQQGLYCLNQILTVKSKAGPKNGKATDNILNDILG